MRKTPLLSITALLLVLPYLSGCGNNDLGANIGLEVNPGKVAIVGGSDYSCADLAAVGGDIPTKSISENRIKFSNMKLEWKSTDSILYITAIRILMTHPSIGGGSFSKTIDSTEIEAMLGLVSAVVPAKDPTLATNPENQYSTDNARKNAPYKACGFQIGGITFTNPDKPGAFTVRVKIELYGYAQNIKSGEQTPVKQVVYANAQSLF
jgi:hypothetical protein